MFENVIVGVDRHGGGRDAIALAKELRDEAGSLTLAHVYSGDGHTWGGSPPEHDLDKRAKIAELLETAGKEAGVVAAMRWRESPRSGVDCTSCASRSRPTCWSWAHPIVACSAGCCSATTRTPR
jgi:nucleotide-binding universal stress UspA family protein